MSIPNEALAKVNFPSVPSITCSRLNLAAAPPRDRSAVRRHPAADQPGADTDGRQTAGDAAGPAHAERDIVTTARHGRLRGRRQDVNAYPAPPSIKDP